MEPESRELEVLPGMTFEHLEPTMFAAFRKTLGLSLDDLQLSFADEPHGGATQEAGKSGALFWFSRDERYVLKSVPWKEVDKLVDMLPEYIDHFRDAMRRNRCCLLPRLFGAYCLRAGDVELLVIGMDNILDGSKPTRIYDLKGTTEDRFV